MKVPEEEAEAEEGGEVVDLLAVLSRSLGGGTGAGASPARKRAPARKAPARKKAAAKRK